MQSNEANNFNQTNGLQQGGNAKLNLSPSHQKSRFKDMKSNQLRIYPLEERTQKEEDCSVIEKETPGINLSLNSPNKIDLLSNQNSQFKLTQPGTTRDMFNRHYSVDASKFLFMSSQFDGFNSRNKPFDDDNQNETDLKKDQMSSQQQLKNNLSGRERMLSNEQETEPRISEITEMQTGMNLLKNSTKNQWVAEGKKRLSEQLNRTPKLIHFGATPKVSRRNGVTPNQNSKQMLGRITFLNMQSAQNQALSESETQSVDIQQATNSNGTASFLMNKKLSLSWRFINILVLMQTLMAKLKIASQTYRYSKLNETHYFYINDITNIQTEKKNIYKNHFVILQEYFADFRLVKWMGKLSVLKPENMISILWKTFMLMIIMSQIVYLPIKIAFFDFEPDLDYTQQILLSRVPLAACIVDILINFNLAFFSPQGLVVQDRIGIIQNYLRFPFWLDLITTISLTLSDLKYPDLCFLLRIFQVFEIVKLLDDRFQLSQRFNTPYTLIKLIATILILSHIFGCGFYYMSFYDPSYNWVVSSQLQSKPWGTLYLKSLYFIIITMITVGFGDITPKNNAETIYVLGIALLSCFQFGYTVNIIGSLFQEKAQQEAIIKYQKYQISTYMRQRMINTSLQTLVLKNLDYIQTQQIDAPEQGLSILDKVSENLKNQVKFEFYWKMLKNQPFLNVYFSQSFLKSLTSVMTERTYIPGEFVYQINQPSQTNSLHFLLKGSVELTIHSLYEKTSKKKFTVQQKKPGDFFGHYSFFTSQPRETDCECQVTSHIISCTQADFLAVAKEFPADYEKFCFLRDQILVCKLDKNVKCVACQKFGHTIVDCPFIHLANLKNIVIQKFNYTEDNKRDLDFTRKLTKSNALTKIPQMRNDLKKMRIKLVKQLVQEKERKQRKSSQPSQTIGGLIAQKSLVQSNLINESLDDESSLESSDLSEYKYELQLEDEKIVLKRQNRDFPVLSSYFDKQFYYRHPKIKLNEKQFFIQSSSSDQMSDEEKSESSESEGTVFMNNIHLKDTFNIMEGGISQTDIEYPVVKINKKQNQKKEFLKQTSKLNTKIAQILKYNYSNIEQSLETKNLRARGKRVRPDSAPQRKSIIAQPELQNQLYKVLVPKQRASSAKMKKKQSFDDDDQKEYNEQKPFSKMRSHTHFIQVKERVNPQNKQKYKEDLQIDSQANPKTSSFGQSQNQKLSKSQIQSEESISSKSSLENANNHQQDQKFVYKSSLNTIEEYNEQKSYQKQGSFSIQDSSQRELSLRDSEQQSEQERSIQQQYPKLTSNISNSPLLKKEGTALIPSKQIDIGPPVDLTKIYKRKQSVMANPQFITKIKSTNTLQKIDLIKKHLQSKNNDSDDDEEHQEIKDFHKKSFQNKKYQKLDFTEELPSPLEKNDTSLIIQSPQIQTVKERFDSPNIDFQKKKFSLYAQKIDLEEIGTKNRQRNRAQTITFSKKNKLTSQMINSLSNHNNVSNSNINKNNNNQSNQSIIHQQSSKEEKKDMNKSTLANSSMNKSQNMPSIMKQQTPVNDNNATQENNNMFHSNSKEKNKHQQFLNQQDQEEIKKIDQFTATDFEKMKIFKIYFPMNNVTNVLESYAKYLIKRFIVNRVQSGVQQKNNQSSIVPVIGSQPNALNFVNILKKRLMVKQHRNSMLSVKQ